MGREKERMEVVAAYVKGRGSFRARSRTPSPSVSTAFSNRNCWPKAIRAFQRPHDSRITTLKCQLFLGRHIGRSFHLWSMRERSVKQCFAVNGVTATVKPFHFLRKMERLWNATVSLKAFVCTHGETIFGCN